jgi:hypothetical protein
MSLFACTTVINLIRKVKVMVKRGEFRYLDQVNVEISFIETPIEVSSVKYCLEIPNPAIPEGEIWNEDAWISELNPLIQGKLETHPRPYILDVKKNHYSWGADSAQASIFLAIATNAVIGVSVSAITPAIISTFRALSAKGLDSSEGKYSREEAVSRAKWLIESKYGELNFEDLTVIGETMHKGGVRWEISLRSTDGKQLFEVEIGFIDGIPGATKIARKSNG